MSETLDLSILDSGNPASGLVLGRTSHDLAVANLPYGNSLGDLEAFRSLIERSQLGEGRQLTNVELNSFGRELFHFCIRDDLARLYARLPSENVRIQLLVNDPTLKSIPWEFITLRALARELFAVH